MQYRTLGKTGWQVSALSLGASPLGSVFRTIDEAEGIRAVHTALDLGINLIDVSPYYGITKAETVLGKALKGVARDRYYLATKVGRYGMDEFDFSAARVTASVDESLGRLGVETIDLIQCHDIEFGSLDQVVEETIPALRKLQAAGKVRQVGITGFPLRIFPNVMGRVEVDTILSYCHYELNNTRLADLLPYLETKGVGVISASPLGMGLLTNRGTPEWHPATDKIKQACQEAAAYCRARGAEIAKLAVQFSVAHPGIATTLVGSASAENMRKNVEWIAEPLDKELLAGVLAILQPIHNEVWSVGRAENN